MSPLDKILTGGIGIAFVAGVVAGRVGSKPAVASVTKTVAIAESSGTLAIAEKTKDVDHKDVVTTTVKKPDGTQTTVIVDKSVVVDHATEKVAETTESKSTVTSMSTTYQPTDRNWSLGITYAPSYALRGQAYSVSAFSPEIGYRLFSGVWLEAGFHTESHTPTIGIRAEF
jgi:hypothetical protein